MSWSFKARVKVRWWGITAVGLGAIVGLYAVINASAQPLLSGGDITKVICYISSALWLIKLWFGMGILFGVVMASLYVSNADTELWHMGEIELTKRIAAYEAELARRKVK